MEEIVGIYGFGVKRVLGKEWWDDSRSKLNIQNYDLWALEWLHFRLFKEQMQTENLHNGVLNEETY